MLVAVDKMSGLFCLSIRQEVVVLFSKVNCPYSNALHEEMNCYSTATTHRNVERNKKQIPELFNCIFNCIFVTSWVIASGARHKV